MVTTLVEMALENHELNSREACCELYNSAVGQTGRMRHHSEHRSGHVWFVAMWDNIVQS